MFKTFLDHHPYLRALLTEWCWSVEAYSSNLDQEDGLS